MSIHLHSEKKLFFFFFLVFWNLNLIAGGIGIHIHPGLLVLLAFSLRSPDLEIWGKWSEDLDFRVNGRVRVISSTKIFQLSISVKNLSILVLILCFPFWEHLWASLNFSSSSDFLNECLLVRNLLYHIPFVSGSSHSWLEDDPIALGSASWNSGCLLWF